MAEEFPFVNEPIDFDKALADPPDLTAEAPEIPRRPKVPVPVRPIENQLLSAKRAFDMRDDFSNGFRDVNSDVNDESFALFGPITIAPTSDQINIELDKSNTDRAELGIDPIDENVFRRFRDPENARTLASQFVIAMGLEQVLGQDLTEL